MRGVILEGDSCQVVAALGQEKANALNAKGAKVSAMYAKEDTSKCRFPAGMTTKKGKNSNR